MCIMFCPRGVDMPHFEWCPAVKHEQVVAKYSTRALSGVRFRGVQHILQCKHGKRTLLFACA